MSNQARAQARLIPIGIEARVERTVPFEWTIASYDSSLPPVLSTPAMIGFMEHATVTAVKPHLGPGAITVGTRVEIDHVKAAPAGSILTVTAKLVAHDGRFLTFEVEARSGETVLGRGKVSRAIVEPKSFESKAHSHKKS
jgi:predicted thioesterase